jgi:hypothetical protein
MYMQKRRRSERDTQSSSSIPILPSERRKLLLGVKYVCTGVELKMQLRMTLCCSLVGKKAKRRIEKEKKLQIASKFKSYYYELMRSC